MFVCKLSENSKICFEYDDICLPTKFYFDEKCRGFLSHCMYLTHKGGFAGDVSIIENDTIYSLRISECQDQYITIKYDAICYLPEKKILVEVSLKIPALDFISAVKKLFN